ncbi:uncharacterized protein LOC116305621 [Actinia tenebrosa]|uniref:Uncharacterized protein LOC116305621 n=1 Tax=Actinia tenebrosa TaxID=6105 RepID=A0A6P8J0G7_ACTTE|nr:uncharacterized protein LOC116305621 [Actinia tenebrosa]
MMTGIPKSWFYSVICAAFCSRISLSNGCKEMHFRFGVDGYALANHTFLTDKALDDDHCQSKCFMDDRCISYNFGRGASWELQTCELNEADHKQFPEDLVPRPDTTYNMAENTCNCTANEICRMNFVNMTHYCERKPGKYEKSITFKNCKSLQNLGEEIILDGSNPVQTGICRSVLTTTVDSPVRPYRVIVEMYSYNVGNSRVMHPGIIFNVQDEDNFDFLFTRNHMLTKKCRNSSWTYASTGNYSHPQRLLKLRTSIQQVVQDGGPSSPRIGDDFPR